MNGQEQLEVWGFQDPDMVGSSEYRAIFDCLADIIDSCRGEVEDDGGDLRGFVAVCADEMESWAMEFRTKLEAVAQ